MNLLKYYQQYRDKWWALPLVLPALLLPVARWANTYTMLNGHMVFLYYLPLALVLSLMMFFGWAAIPGIIIGLLLTLAHGMMFEQSIGVLFHFLIPCVLCWGGYRIFVPQRQQVSHGNVRLMPHRLFWQMLLPSVIFLILSQIAEYLGLHPRTTEMTGVTPFSLRSLITFQALMVGCLTGMPLCYFVLRVIRNPFHLRGFISQVRLQIDPKIKKIEIICWATVLILLLWLLLMPLNDSSTIFSTNYTLSLLMPVMLWGAMRFGYRFISLIWTPVLIAVIHFHYRYLPIYPSYNTQLAITSSSYLVFSFIVAYTAMLATQQRLIYARVRQMAFLDPVVHMPNLRALPGLRLAINLSPVSLSRSQFPQEVEALLQAYNIEPWQIIFELTENYALSNPELVCQTLEHLRALGCRVAIDDFGTGYASYARLKTMNVDILKIDGSFIRNLLASSLDYQVVDSICRLARMKNMQVVAEYVESPEIRQAVITLGIDYMQGYDIGVPVPLTQLAEEMTG